MSEEPPKQKPKFEVLQGGKSQLEKKHREAERVAYAFYENPNANIEMVTPELFEILLDRVLYAECMDGAHDKETLDRYGETIIIRLMFFLRESKAQKVYHSDEIHDQLEEILAQVIKKKMEARGDHE